MPHYIFSPFELDPEARVLRRDGEPVPMTGKTLDTLLLLVQNRGRLVDKDELLSRVWSGSVVEEANLTQSIFTVRKILGDNPKDHRYIATVAGRGYQFVAPVTEATAATSSIPETVGEVRQAPASHFFRLPSGINRRQKATLGFVAVAFALFGLVWFLMRRPPKPMAELSQRRLTFNSGVNIVASGAVSIDGKYLAYSDGAGIHIKLLSTGEERLIPTPSGVRSSTLSYIDCWFPDGTQLLAHSNDVNGIATMWTISVMGRSPRQLRDRASGWAVSPDGTRIAFSPTETYKRFKEIWVMDSPGGNPRKVLGLGNNEWLWSVRWSPDGQHLIYIRAKDLLNKVIQVTEILDLKSAARQEVVVASDVDPWVQGVAWLPDGRIIYSQMESPLSNDANLWQVPLKRGKPAGKPSRITNWAGSNLVGLSTSADGKRIALRKETFQEQVLLGKLSAGGTHMSSPRRLIEDEADDMVTAWTADSKAVIVISDRNGRPDLFKQAITQDTAEPLVTGPKGVLLARISPDGAWILYMEMEWSPLAGNNPPFHVMRVPVNGGLPQFVLETRNTGNFECSQAPARLCVILEPNPDQNRLMLTAFDPLRGRGKLLRTIETAPGNSAATGLSPDGSTFAYARRRRADLHIRLLSLYGGSDREITVKGWPNISGLNWSADGKGFYCGFGSSHDTNPLLGSSHDTTLLHVDLKGTARVIWNDKEVNRTGLIAGVPSPDGRYIALLSRVHTSSIWMVEGF